MRFSSSQATMQSAFEGTNEYWSFAKRGRRPHAHGLLSYPAMMVPEMMGELLERLQTFDHDIKTVYDPFVGSGTVLTECMLRGLDFIGTDINPLAILSCRVKTDPPFFSRHQSKETRLIANLTGSDPKARIPNFPGVEKWYSEEAAMGLATLSDAIRKIPNQATRRFYWLALAGIARSHSNSRMSTYKLHKRSADDTSMVGRNIFKDFNEKIEDMTTKINGFWKDIEDRSLLKNGHYKGDIYLSCKDVRRSLEYTGEQADLLITSPPYGDNTTTIPYGQYSYLPLNWIDLKDIGDDAPEDLTLSPYAIDSSSLGGSKRNAEEKSMILVGLSPTYKRINNALSDMPNDRQKRLTAFVYDMHLAINAVVPRVKKGGHFVWVVGDRKIGGKSIQLSRILSDLMDVVGCPLHAQAFRNIPSKKMAIRNSIGETMQEEIILGFTRE